ncbi:MAG TPA: hypothetical protein DIW46_02360 [Microbacterium sp.]|nr:hypothetical protein [Microbacterium sp.]
MRCSTKLLAPLLGVLAVGAILMSGCAPASAGDPAADKPTVKEPVAAPSVAPSPSATSESDATTSFLAWLTASRVPEVDEACAPLAPDLVDRMLAEMRSDGFPEVSTCEEMITVSAELYRAFDQSAEVDIDVQSETASDAVLFVTYLASGDCGTVVMQRPASEWIITEQTEECA